jgi:hypothetical protein
MLAQFNYSRLFRTQREDIFGRTCRTDAIANHGNRTNRGFVHCDDIVANEYNVGCLLGIVICRVASNAQQDNWQTQSCAVKIHHATSFIQKNSNRQERARLASIFNVRFGLRFQPVDATPVQIRAIRVSNQASASYRSAPDFVSSAFALLVSYESFRHYGTSSSHASRTS